MIRFQSRSICRTWFVSILIQNLWTVNKFHMLSQGYDTYWDWLYFSPTLFYSKYIFFLKVICRITAIDRNCLNMLSDVKKISYKINATFFMENMILMEDTVGCHLSHSKCNFFLPLWALSYIENCSRVHVFFIWSFCCPVNIHYIVLWVP